MLVIAIKLQLSWFPYTLANIPRQAMHIHCLLEKYHSNRVKDMILIMNIDFIHVYKYIYSVCVRMINTQSIESSSVIQNIV